MIKILEFIQLIATFMGFAGLIPNMVNIFKKKSLATNVLNVPTTALYVTDTLLRLPNVGRGLFQSIQIKDFEGVKRNGIICLGIWIMCIMMYITLVLIAYFNTGTEETNEKEKKINKFLKVILSLFGISVISYIFFGFIHITILLSITVFILCIIKIIIFSKDDTLHKTNKDKRNAILLSIIFGLFITYSIIYYIKGIRHALYSKNKI